MSVWELLILAVGLSMDAFAVSLCKGLSARSAGIPQQISCGLWFGSFQAIMPVLGFYLGALFLSAISRYDHWVAFFLMAAVGVNMLKEAFEPQEREENDFSCRAMFLLAVATSIDALAVGISLSMAGNVFIWGAAFLIGSVTAGLSVLGVRIGRTVGEKFQTKAQILGGIILLALGFKILLEHLGE